MLGLIDGRKLPATVERRQEGPEDSHGNPTITYAPAEVVEGCYYDPRRSDTDGWPQRQADELIARIFAPLGTQVDVGDKVGVYGQEFEVAQPPLLWTPGSLLPIKGRVEIYLRRWEG